MFKPQPSFPQAQAQFVVFLGRHCFVESTAFDEYSSRHGAIADEIHVLRKLHAVLRFNLAVVLLVPDLIRELKKGGGRIRRDRYVSIHNCWIGIRVRFHMVAKKVRVTNDVVIDEKQKLSLSGSDAIVSGRAGAAIRLLNDKSEERR